MDALALHDAIAAVCPIEGVSVAIESDRTTWQVFYAPSATDAQKTDALAALAAFDPAAVPVNSEIRSQDLMAQFTADDAVKIQAAVGGNVQFWLLWSAMQAQKDPMGVTNARFLAGWRALIQVLGQPRMDAIAASLNVSIAA